jgi:glycosyltransferase involved in cell wall biosynthesis
VGVDYLGYVPETDLPGLTAGAHGFVYPSLYEGFGFPLAQAMAAGVPSITSNISALPEVAGNAALLVDPRSSFELRDAIWKLIDSADLRAELGRKARAQASKFTWKNSARLSAEFFRRVCDS